MSTLRVSNIEAKSDPSSSTADEQVKITNSNGDVLLYVDGRTSGITTVGINTTAQSFEVDSNNNFNFTGIVTATKFSGPVDTTTGTFSSDVTISGNLGVAGTITYEDVARVDATGVSTFREGFGVGPLAGIALTAYKDGSIRTSGVITATTYYGSGANLTGIDATQIVTGNTSVQTVDTGSDGHVKVTTEGSERLRIDNGGRLHIGATTGPSNSKLSITGTDATNYITLKNTTASDSSGTRKSIIVFQGTRSGGEVTDLVHIAGQHDGGSDNDWGAFRVLVNNGSGVTERFGIGQGGEVRINAQIGSAGQVLQSAGSGSPAVWATPASSLTSQSVQAEMVGDQTMGTNAWNLVKFNAQNWDTGSNYDHNTGNWYYQAPSTGKYWYKASAKLIDLGADKEFDIALYKSTDNGGSYTIQKKSQRWVFTRENTASVVIVETTGLMELTSGHRIRVYTWHNHGSNRDLDDNFCLFEVFRLGD